MSGLIHTEGRNEYSLNNSKSYVSTKPFNQEFLTYTVTKANFVTTGATAPVTTDAALTPAGRILHLTGRKLLPGQNPGVTTFLVSVYDPISFLTGYIDPSSSTFAKYDQNLPNFFDNGPTANGSTIPPLGGQAGKLTLFDSGALSVAVGGNLAAGNATIGRVTITGAAGTTTITTSAARNGSRIILTPANSVTQTLSQTVNVSGGGGGSVTVSFAVPMGYFATATTDGSFTITTVGASLSANPVFIWLVIN